MSATSDSQGTTTPTAASYDPKAYVEALLAEQTERDRVHPRPHSLLRGELHVMRTVSHSIVQTALKTGGSHRHAAYDAASQVADLAHPTQRGLYDEDAAAIAEALPTILSGAYIPGQLAELFAIAADIADRVADGYTENIEIALQEVATEHQRKHPTTPTK